MKYLFTFFYFLIFFPSYVKLCLAHPHVFIDADFKLSINKDFCVEKLSENWHFDPIFSAGVLMDFSKNKKNFTTKEKQKLHDTIYKSMSYFDYFQHVTKNNQKIKMDPPYIFDISYNKIVNIYLETKPKKPLKLEKGSRYIFSVFDPSFYVNVDYKKDKDITIENLPKFCKSRIIRPDPNQVLMRDAQTFPEDFFDDPTQSLNLSYQLAIKLEITC